MLIQYERDVPLRINKKSLLKIQEKAREESDLVLYAIENLLTIMSDTAIYSNISCDIGEKLIALVQERIGYFDMPQNINEDLTDSYKKSRQKLFRLVMSKYNIK